MPKNWNTVIRHAPRDRHHLGARRYGAQLTTTIPTMVADGIAGQLAKTITECSRPSPSYVMVKILDWPRKRSMVWESWEKWREKWGQYQAVYEVSEQTRKVKTMPEKVPEYRGKNRVDKISSKNSLRFDAENENYLRKASDEGVWKEDKARYLDVMIGWVIR
jgi:hypothetical protein